MPSEFKKAPAHLGTALADIYTVPTGATAVVIGAQVANVHVATTPLDANVDLAIVDVGTNDVFYLTRNLTVPVGSAIDLITGKVVLKAGDKIQARGDIATALDLIVAVLEVT